MMAASHRQQEIATNQPRGVGESMPSSQTSMTGAQAATAAEQSISGQDIGRHTNRSQSD